MYDFHTHFIPTEMIDWVKENKLAINAKWEKKDPNKKEFLVINEKWGFELKDTFLNEELYLQEQQDAGVSHSIISPIPQLFMYDFNQAITREAAEVYNEALVSLVEKYPTRLSALGTVPLQHPTHAADILQKAMNAGLKGAIIGPGLAGQMLTDDFFIPFFEEANRLHAILFIHPLLSEDPRLKRRMMPNLIGVPWETTVCATDILLSGFIDKYPNIKILFAHGGGLMPYQIGRIEKGYEMWSAVSSQLQVPPTEYVTRFWYDSVLWNDHSLTYLESIVGADRIVPGSDYPFDLADWPPKEKYTMTAKKLLGS